MPPLLQAVEAAQDWMGASITEHPAPAQALFATTGLFARAGVTHAVFLPVWAYPAAGFGDRDDLPSLRSGDADRLVGRDRPVTWRWPSSTWWPRAPELSTGSRPPPSRASMLGLMAAMDTDRRV